MHWVKFSNTIDYHNAVIFLHEYGLLFCIYPVHVWGYRLECYLFFLSNVLSVSELFLSSQYVAGLNQLSASSS